MLLKIENVKDNEEYSFPGLPSPVTPDVFFDNFMDSIDTNTMHVEVTNGALKGTIGRFVSFLPPNKRNYYFSSYGMVSKKETYRKIMNIVLVPGTKVCILIDNSFHYVSLANCSWKIGYTGPHIKTSSVVRKVKEKPIPEVFDKLGTQIQIGDFCIFVLYHYVSSGAQSYFGNVTKITSNGTVYCTPVDVGDHYGHIPSERKVLDPDMITVLSEDLMDKILMARLSS